MNPQITMPRTFSIIVGLDYSEASTLALQQAARFAETRDRSQIHVVHCSPSMALPRHGLGTPDLTAGTPTAEMVPSAVLATEMRRLQTYVETALTQLDDADSAKRSSVRWTMHLRLSDPTQAIVQLAADIEADLVVIGTHGRGWLAHFLLGSVAEGIVRRAPCAVLVVRPTGATAAGTAPQIEPPCPDCISVRTASEGAVFWCDRHREHHERAHTYHFTPFRDSHQSGELLHPLG